MAAVASRYARALVDVVIDDKIDPTTAIQQVNDIVAAVNESDQLRMVWESPAIPSEQKRGLLDAIVVDAKFVSLQAGDPVGAKTRVARRHRRACRDDAPDSEFFRHPD